jgi:hypothetical protein
MYEEQLLTTITNYVMYLIITCIILFVLLAIVSST